VRIPIKPAKKKFLRRDLPARIIVGAAIILFTIVVVLAFQNINREKRYMSQILSEKGAALIKAFEAGARTGMMGMGWRGDQVQNLLEATARQQGILYLSVTDTNGLIIAHSDRSRIGQTFLDQFSLATLQPGAHEKWRLRDYENGKRSFEVYRYFQPWANGVGSKDRAIPRDRCREWGMMQNNWCFPLTPAENKQIIFVGLDVTPFEDARKEDIRNTIIISSVLVLLGFGGFYLLFLAQSYQATRRLLQDTSALAHEVVTNLPVGLIVTDRESKIAFLNGAAEKITGLAFNAVHGKSLGEMLPSCLRELLIFLDQGKTVVEQEMECVFVNQEVAVPLSVSAARIVNEEGDWVGSILILRDLKEVRSLQEEIRRKEKLAALGSLAAGFAHEIRNPLSSIKGLASFFGSKFPEGSKDKEAAGVMVREVDRLNRVVSELLEFARPSDLNLKPTDINGLLEHSLRLIQPDAQTKNIKLHFVPKDHLPPVLIDPDRFSQSLLNLYLNAMQAMDEGGTLSVKSQLENQETLRIEIADTGKGIAPENLHKIFDPYFTTKASGTGLGLAIVHKIMDAHQGNIKVKSTAGRGTAFTITVPVLNQSDQPTKRLP
jgi:two-component system sensor histidine kinase HydH